MALMSHREQLQVVVHPFLQLKCWQYAALEHGCCMVIQSVHGWRWNGKGGGCGDEVIGELGNCKDEVVGTEDSDEGEVVGSCKDEVMGTVDGGSVCVFKAWEISCIAVETFLSASTSF